MFLFVSTGMTLSEYLLISKKRARLLEQATVHNLFATTFLQHLNGLYQLAVKTDLNLMQFHFCGKTPDLSVNRSVMSKQLLIIRNFSILGGRMNYRKKKRRSHFTAWTPRPALIMPKHPVHSENKHDLVATLTNPR